MSLFSLSSTLCLCHDVGLCPLTVSFCMLNHARLILTFPSLMYNYTYLVLHCRSENTTKYSSTGVSPFNSTFDFEVTILPNFLHFSFSTDSHAIV